MTIRAWVKMTNAVSAFLDNGRDARADRGSGSVDTAIVVGLVAAAALVLAGLMTGAIESFGDKIPQ